MSQPDLRPESLVIHGGQAPEPITGAVMPPIFLSSTYAQESPGKHKGFEYTRSHNPTRYALERAIAILEGGTITQDDDPSCGGFAFASGLAGIGTLLELLDHGDEVVAMDDLYGGTQRLFRDVRERSQGLTFKLVDLSDTSALRNAVTDRTRLIWVETPSNPMLKLADLDAVAAVGQEHGILTACDNTFATSILQRPLSHGIDIVSHSVTKYIGGHSDVVGGMLVTSNMELAERIRFLQNSVGSIMSPFDSYMTLRGVKTLALRMERHCQSALEIATWLQSHPNVERVIYPGLKSHPQYELMTRQMRIDGHPAGGGMITVYLKGDIETTRTALERFHLFTLAESLGGVESLIEHPAIMTHASVPVELREALGISDTMIRLSVGIEHVDDLKADIDQAIGS
jgi:cystathionine gamma-lyase